MKRGWREIVSLSPTLLGYTQGSREAAWRESQRHHQCRRSAASRIRCACLLFPAATLFTILGCSAQAGASGGRRGESAAPPPVFRKDDFIVVLVTGQPLQSTIAGYSGQGSLFVGSGTSTAGKITFTGVPGAQSVNLERRSGTDVTNRGNYGTGAYVPPGIYFLHYHRFDPTHGGRPRLGLGDARCGEVIAKRTGGAPLDREHVQFHIAFNDLAEITPKVSEGCVTLRRAEFESLFPASFFSADSPLPGCSGDPTPTPYSGAGRILVFITDATDAGIHGRQVAFFRSLIRGEASGGVTAANFVSGSAELQSLRTRWYSGLP
jgi:hypothetical protein